MTKKAAKRAPKKGKGGSASKGLSPRGGASAHLSTRKKATPAKARSVGVQSRAPVKPVESRMRKLVEQPHGGAIVKGQKGDPPGPGRPPKLLSMLLKDLKAAGYESVGPSTMLHTMEYMIGLPESELKRMASDKEAPMAQRILAKHLSKQSVGMLMELLDRAHGKAKQQVALDGDLNLKATITFKEPPSGD